MTAPRRVLTTPEFPLNAVCRAERVPGVLRVAGLC
jgi:hypothetical protein